MYIRSLADKERDAWIQVNYYHKGETVQAALAATALSSMHQNRPQYSLSGEQKSVCTRTIQHFANFVGREAPVVEGNSQFYLS